MSDIEAKVPDWLSDETPYPARCVPVFYAPTRGRENQQILLVALLPDGNKVYLPAFERPANIRRFRVRLQQLQAQVTALQEEVAKLSA